MKAITRTEYGAPHVVLKWSDFEKPSPGDDEVLVRVHAAGLNAGDVAIVEGTPYLIRPVYGMLKPKSPLIGQDLAGTVEAVGSSVDRFAPGDEVYGSGSGSFAELAAAPAKRLAPKPPSLSFEEAAALSIAGLTALQGLRDAGGVQGGDRVLINGASGGVGTYAIQIAKALGAEVTAVCSSQNVGQARELGASRVIDYTEEDFTELGDTWDVIFDNAASHSLGDTRKALAAGGVLIPNNGNLKSRWLASVPRMLAALTTSLFTNTRTRIHAQTWNPDDLLELNRLVDAGDVRPAIDRTYPIREAADALDYVGEGHARAKVVLTV